MRICVCAGAACECSHIRLAWRSFPRKAALPTLPRPRAGVNDQGQRCKPPLRPPRLAKGTRATEYSSARCGIAQQARTGHNAVQGTTLHAAGAAAPPVCFHREGVLTPGSRCHTQRAPAAALCRPTTTTAHLGYVQPQQRPQGDALDGRQLAYQRWQQVL